MSKQKLKPFIDETGKRHDHFYVDQSSGILYFKKGHSGRKIKFSTKHKVEDFVKAKRFANQEFDRLTGKKKGGGVHSLIKDELAIWLKIKETEGLAYDTVNNVRRAKKQIEEFWGSRFPHEFTRENMPAWYEFWAKRHPGIDMENAIKYARNFSRFLNQKIVDGKPLLPVIPEIKDPNYKKIRRRRKKKKEKILSGADVQRVFQTAPDPEMGLVTLIMYTMATRITETLEMRFDEEIDLDHEPPRYCWSDGQNKADLDGWHALHPKLVPLLQSLRRRRLAEGTNRLFPQKHDNSKALREQQVDWRAWRERAGIKWHWTPHTFRHTCLSNLFNDPKNPQALICKLYRVSLAVALETYVKPTNEGRALMMGAITVNI
jgi:integrase